MKDGSFIPVGRAADKVVVELNSRRPSARKVLAADLANINAGLAAGLSLDAIRDLHAKQEREAIVFAFTRLARYTSPAEAVDFVEKMLMSVPGGK